MPHRRTEESTLRAHAVRPTKAEAYVIAVRNTQALWSNLSAEERKEVEDGLRWAEVFGQIYTGPKLRGRPPGSRNRLAQVPLSDELTTNNAALPNPPPMFEEQ